MLFIIIFEFGYYLLLEMTIVASLLRFAIAMLSQTRDYFLLSDATYDFDSYNDIH